MSNFTTRAIKAINVDAEYKVEYDDWQNIIWLNGTTPISNEDIAAKQVEIEAEYNAQAYARTRADAYPSIGDQLDMLWHAVDTGDWTAAKVKTTEFYTALKAVKDANPKP